MNEHDAAISAQTLANLGPAPGSRAQHFRGGYYRVLVCSVNENTRESLVTYQDEKTGFVWTRSLDQWREWVTNDQGELRQRFTVVDELPPLPLDQMDRDATKYDVMHAALNRLHAKSVGVERHTIAHVKANLPTGMDDIDEKDIDVWISKHRHPERYQGAIGGGITRHTTQTSIGPMTILQCSCGRAAWVDHNW